MSAVVHRSFKLKPSTRSVEPAGQAHFDIAVEVTTGVVPVSRAELEADVEASEKDDTFTEVVRVHFHHRFKYFHDLVRLCVFSIGRCIDEYSEACLR
jgi:hypothetical protein